MIGVKQGDPLSPLLFGLFIDRVEAWLRDKAPQCGVELGGELLRVLLYADDLTLVAASPEDLQELLDALQEFCVANSLHVNVDKSAVVVFGQRKPGLVGKHIPRAGWVLDGDRLPVVPEFRYLGITFHETSGVSACVPALSAAAMPAMWCMLSRCKTMEMPTLQLRVSLFESLVSPILSYCSEVWGPSVLKSCSTPYKCLDLALNRPLLVFLRRLGGNLRKSTRHELLLHEFGVRPLARSWLRSSVMLWNRVAGLPESDPLAAAMRENVSSPHRPKQLWSVGLESFLRHIRFELPPEGLRCVGEWVQLPVVEVLSAFDTWWCREFSEALADPRNAPTSQVSLCTYEQWFATEPVMGGYDRGCLSRVPGYVANTAGIPTQHVRSLAAFRVGAHRLEVATGRWARCPRAERVCQLCGEGAGDEFHVVFECSGQEVPRQLHARLFDEFGGWAGLVPGELRADAMQQFMSQHPRWVASFINACERRAMEQPPDDVVLVMLLTAQTRCLLTVWMTILQSCLRCWMMLWRRLVFCQYPMSLWLPSGLHGSAVPITVTVTVIYKALHAFPHCHHFSWGAADAPSPCRCQRQSLPYPALCDGCHPTPLAASRATASTETQTKTPTTGCRKLIAVIVLFL